MKPRHLFAIISGILGVGGLSAAGAVLGASLHSSTTPTGVSSLAYAESSACSGCPAGTHLDSVEVQKRQGSILFILRGGWPSSVDQLKVSVCLNSDSVPLVLKPHGSRNAFEPTVSGAAAPAAATVAQGVATRLQDDALLVNLSGSMQPTVPIVFDVALCNNGSTLQRLPHVGELNWSGTGPPKQMRATSTPTPTLTPTPTPLVAGPAAPSVANACTALPSGSVPPYLQITGWTSGKKTDPVTHVAEESVTATLAGNPTGVNAPFAIIAVIFPAGVTTTPMFSMPLIDTIGTAQLYAWADGTARHKALRTFSGGTWVTDNNPSSMHFSLSSDKTATLFWTGMHAGDQFGFVTAAPAGCASAALTPTFTPQGLVAS
jgi:hypothetical protein